MNDAAPYGYRTKVRHVDATQWTGSNEAEMYAFAGWHFEAVTEPDEDPTATGKVFDATDLSWLLLYDGDWIVRDGHDFYRCHAAEFADRYEPTP